ncbi:unnamed protein product [Trichogramma brassicae]|uniref:HECT domain-containing protein n=1 Tax=Trichogramma brassicae TaxID=86971 RepID=A0A6H5HWM4_9HYME|nr:unnamed protein product [Trichogramma brassicae]
MLMCGADEYSVQGLRACHEANGYSPQFRRTLDWFWQALEGFSRDEMARLVQFVTGSSRLPIDGFKSLDPTFTIVDVGGYGHLPTAHTCVNQLCLPEYRCYEDLERALLYALKEGAEGFGLRYVALAAQQARHEQRQLDRQLDLLPAQRRGAQEHQGLLLGSSAAGQAEAAAVLLSHTQEQARRAPLRGIPSRLPGSTFRSPALGTSPVPQRTPVGGRIRKDGGIKLLDISEQPLGYVQAKRRKRQQEQEEQQKKAEEAKAAAAAAQATAQAAAAAAPAEETATPEYAQGLAPIAAPATPAAPAVSTPTTPTTPHLQPYSTPKTTASVPVAVVAPNPKPERPNVGSSRNVQNCEQSYQTRKALILGFMAGSRVIVYSLLQTNKCNLLIPSSVSLLACRSAIRYKKGFLCNRHCAKRCSYLKGNICGISRQLSQCHAAKKKRGFFVRRPNTQKPPKTKIKNPSLNNDRAAIKLFTKRGGPSTVARVTLGTVGAMHEPAHKKKISLNDFFQMRITNINLDLCDSRDHLISLTIHNTIRRAKWITAPIQSLHRFEHFYEIFFIDNRHISEQETRSCVSNLGNHYDSTRRSQRLHLREMREKIWTKNAFARTPKKHTRKWQKLKADRKPFDILVVEPELRALHRRNVLSDAYADHFIVQRDRGVTYGVNILDVKKLRITPEEERTTTTSEEDIVAEKTQRLRLLGDLCGELKNCRVTNADLQTEAIIYEHLVQLDTLIENWPIDQLPDLGEYLSREEIDWLLTQAVTNNWTYLQFCRGKRLVEFVARSGYRDDQPSEILSRTTPIHRAARCNNYDRHNDYDESNLDAAIDELFKIYDKFGANYVDELGVTHFHVACWHGCADAVQKFLAAGQEPDCREHRKVDPPLYLAAKANRKELVEALLRAGAHPNVANRQGWTSLHAVCMAHRRGCGDPDSHRYDELMQLFLETDKEMGQRAQVDACDRAGYGPLHFALRTGCRGLVEILLRNGADPNLANDDDQTPLHLVSSRDDVDVAAVDAFFAVCDQVGRRVEVDARDYLGNAPLHEAARCGHERVMATLLRRGADPNAANERGLTPLHAISDREADDNMPEINFHNDDDDDDDDVAEAFFKVNDEIQGQVRVDAADRQGRTPLILALLRRRKRTIETLLRRGADPNLPNAHGYTPLHVLCRVYREDDLAKMFLGIVDELRLTLRVDARDNEGRTPLQWAAVNFLPNTVDALLDQGADLASFVFPTVDHFDEAFRRRRRHEGSLDFKLRLPPGALIVVGRLEARGYETTLNDAVTIMRLFAEQRLFAKSKDSLRSLRGDDRFATQAEQIEMRQGLTLYDLIRLPAKEAATALAYSDFLEFARSTGLWGLCGPLQEACVVHLAETTSSGFFRNWALPAYLELTRYRLPILCCDMIIAELTNEDLYNICLAATGQSSLSIHRC